MTDIQEPIDTTQLQADLKDTNDIAFMALRANGELGVVINFLENGFSCADHVAVGRQIFKAMRIFDFGEQITIFFDPHMSAHSGYIAASGNADGGARFRFSLPIINNEDIKEQLSGATGGENEVDFF